MEFFSAYDQGFARIAAAVNEVAIGQPAVNAARIVDHVRELDDDGVGVVVFPELCVTGYSIDDLLMQDVLLDATLAAIRTIAQASASLTPVIVVGAPLRHGTRLFNCAVVIHRGEVLGVVPKSYLPNYREFYEKRWFADGADETGFIELGGAEVPFGPDLLFEATDVPGLVIHAEVCEDMWVPVPPSAVAALAGATVLLNMSGSPITIGRADDRHLLCRSASMRCLAAYAYAAAGPGESTTDLSWDGQTMIYEQGALLAETERFPRSATHSVADVDLDALRQDRLRQGSFDDNARHVGQEVYDFRTVEFTLAPKRTDIGLRRAVNRFPFVPDDEAQLAQDCYEAYNIQVAGLNQRLAAIGNAKVVIGVSGGLDSTQALLVAAKAMDLAGRPRTDILAFTMPGFATSEHTKNNATKLSEALGVTFETLDITASARQMLSDLGHPFGRGEEVYDVTFENVQAGLRTDYLFRIANQRGGIVLGTGDLSELALGWCTYGVGDQMSHYGVNAGVPKTLIQHLIRWIIATRQFDDRVGEILESILGTEITPELVPTREGETPQSTEASVGPYALQDFSLFQVLRRGLRPSKIAFLAWHAWHDADAGTWPPNYPAEARPSYDLATITKWLDVFCTRYFANQFKRSAMPNGPKVTHGGALSPRGDWRMPSDASSAAWRTERATIPETQ